MKLGQIMTLELETIEPGDAVQSARALEMVRTLAVASGSRGMAGGQAVELVQVDLVHLVLFDMHMPRLTGLEAFAVIRPLAMSNSISAANFASSSFCTSAR